MKNGLYSVQFRTPLGTGAGVICVLDGQIRGGDGSIYYTGKFTQEGEKIGATVKTGRHSAGTDSVFGRDNVTIELVGTSEGDSANFEGSAPEAPGVSFSAAVKRICD